MIALPQYFVSVLLVFVLVFSVVYAVLARSKFFSKPDIPALIALSIGLVTILSQLFVNFVVAFLPYIVALLVFIFGIVLLLSTALIPQESMSNYLKKSLIVPVLLIFMVFIFGLIAFGVASSGTVNTANTPSTQPITVTSPSSGQTQTLITRVSFSDLTSQYIISLLTAPSVLSLLLTLGAMAMGVFFMTRDSPKKY
jgi:hypothetical protein